MPDPTRELAEAMARAKELGAEREAAKLRQIGLAERRQAVGLEETRDRFDEALLALVAKVGGRMSYTEIGALWGGIVWETPPPGRQTVQQRKKRAEQGSPRRAEA